MNELLDMERELFHELTTARWDRLVLRNLDEWGISISTHTGERRNRNEDRMVFAHVTSLGQQQFSIAIVCDGVGGSQMGDAAATLAISTLLSELAAQRSNLPLPLLLSNLIIAADDKIRLTLTGRGSTTLSVLLALSTGESIAANIGDSRIFSWSPLASLTQVSVDDTMENELLNYSITDASALNARGLGGSLSQALGEPGRTSDGLRINFISSESLSSGIVLATDGAWKSDERGFKEITRNSRSAAEAVRRISGFAAWMGGVDNVSVIAIEDIDKFAKSSKNRSRLEFNNAWISAWICDTKLILHDRAVFYRKRERARSSEADAPAASPKRAARKSPNSRRDKPDLSPATAQLELEVLQELRYKSDARPKIEISTEPDVEKKSI